MRLLSSPCLISTRWNCGILSLPTQAQPYMVLSGSRLLTAGTIINLTILSVCAEVQVLVRGSSCPCSVCLGLTMESGLTGSDQVDLSRMPPALHSCSVMSPNNLHKA